MQSEFQNVELDRVRYSLVWEGSRTLYKGLDIRPSDRVLIITSAGCNVLNALLKRPAQVVAIDLNPVQNKLLEFKKHLLLRHSYGVFRALMGFDGPGRVREAWQEVEPGLDSDHQRFWSAFFREHPGGLMGAGKLESYLSGFFNTLDAEMQEKLRELLHFTEVAAQRAFFMKELHRGSFRPLFIRYFDQQNLSRGRDPKLFRYARESGGETFYFRLLQQASSVLLKENFFFRFFFFGPLEIPENVLPPCYQGRNFSLLREQLSKLHIVTGEAVDYLLSPEGACITKASLSNIFEYTSEQEFKEACRALFSQQSRELKIIFWNLLQEQAGESNRAIPLLDQQSDMLSRQEDCFYFRNVKLLERQAIPLQLVQR